MTPQEPHPQRCETCTWEGCPVGQIKEDDQDESGYVAELTAKIGCATHTPASEPAPQRVDTARLREIFIEVSNGTECPDDCDKDSCSVCILDEAIALLREGERK